MFDGLLLKGMHCAGGFGNDNADSNPSQNSETGTGYPDPLQGLSTNSVQSLAAQTLNVLQFSQQPV